MSEEEIKAAVDKEKLEEIIQKDSKTGRTVSGAWFYIISGMGVFMVFFYMYCAATPVDTQYFLGFYVLLTYVLVFLKYPLSRKSPKNRPSVPDILLALVAAFVVGYYIVEWTHSSARSVFSSPLKLRAGCWAGR
jgi:TRAP-type uncharacterized transport system fused permease subunit